jgi:hypothetical protein
MLAAGVVGVSAAAAAGTRTVIYRAFTSSGQPAIKVAKLVGGSCFSGSSEADRKDAWRCMTGNFIHDPCFSNPKANGIVLCPTHAWKRSGIEINLSKPLPKKFADTPKPSTKGRPWAMKTFSALKCVLEGMGPFVSPKVFGDYACTNGQWLWGQPNRKASPWTIRIGKTKPTGTAKVKVAWF